MDPVHSASKISLVLADVDGTLVTEDKVLTPRAGAAVKALDAAGIAFAITSGRPPRGMTMLIGPLGLRTPIAAFNGGVFVKPDMTIIEERVLPAEVARRAIEIIGRSGMDVWIYSGQDWLVRDLQAPHVAREQSTVRFAPTVVADFTAVLANVVKIVGVSDDRAARRKRKPRSAQPPRRPARSLTISMSPTRTLTKARWSRCSPSCCRSPARRSPPSATCRTTY
jgi:hydroxymethylpyrimidine pyrophosphatase-like HAD family hydrolase